jgi:predicted dienelactone hydrolase
MSIMNNAVLQKKEDKSYPVIIFSHGLSSHMHSHSVRAKQLASEGYIVMLPQHEELVYPWDDKGTKFYF